MGDAVDLTGDGGVVKRVIRKARDDAIAPSDSLSLVDERLPQFLSQGNAFWKLTRHLDVKQSLTTCCHKPS